MKIKRFEADSMADALRMIKKEFGEDAVILSATSHKKADGVPGPQSEQVVVTAAIDYREPDAEENRCGQPCATPESTSGAAEPARRTPLSHLEPISRTGREKLRAKFVQLAAETQSGGQSGNTLRKFRDRMLREGISPELTAELIEAAGALLAGSTPDHDLQAILSHILEAKNIVAPVGSAPLTLALVGPCGVGKTTTAAKLAAEASSQGRRTALISIDQQRAAGSEELKRYARILGITMRCADTPEALAAELNQLKGNDVLVIDTPGISPGETTLRDRLKRFLKRLPNAEVHLLVNAALTGGGMRKTIDCFRPLGPGCLIYTQIDWAASCGELLNTALWSGLAISYFSDSALVSEYLHRATPERLANLLWSAKMEEGTVPSPSDTAGDSDASQPRFQTAMPMACHR